MEREQQKKLFEHMRQYCLKHKMTEKEIFFFFRSFQRHINT